MTETIQELEAGLCQALCAKVKLRPRPDGNIYVSTPFSFPDGDHLSIYLRRLPSGGFRLTDLGSTMMHLSYEQDVDKLKDGNRNKVFTQILSEVGISDDDGELFVEVPAQSLATGIFQLGQGLTRVHDLTFLNRVQVENTFYEDLKGRLQDIVGQERIIENYVPRGVDKAEEYTADFCIEGGKRPLLIWGVPSQTKARLATIVLQHLRQQQFSFRSLIVYADMAAIPRADVSRLTTAANDQIPSLTEADALKDKILDAVA